jgi:hypothetical protein
MLCYGIDDWSKLVPFPRDEDDKSPGESVLKSMALSGRDTWSKAALYAKKHTEYGVQSSSRKSAQFPMRGVVWDMVTLYLPTTLCIYQKIGGPTWVEGHWYLVDKVSSLQSGDVVVLLSPESPGSVEVARVAASDSAWVRSRSRGSETITYVPPGRCWVDRLGGRQDGVVALGLVSGRILWPHITWTGNATLLE